MGQLARRDRIGAPLTGMKIRIISLRATAAGVMLLVAVSLHGTAREVVLELELNYGRPSSERVAQAPAPLSHLIPSGATSMTQPRGTGRLIMRRWPQRRPPSCSRCGRRHEVDFRSGRLSA